MIRHLIVILCCLSMAVPAMAQTLLTDKPAEQKAWEVLLKLFFPTIWTAAAPYLTRGVTWGMLKVMTSVPQPLQVVVSSVLGGILAGIAGAIPDFPLSIESAATMGAAGGAAGQVLLAAQPGKIPGEPGTETK
jgi:hypothetical protein